MSVPGYTVERSGLRWLVEDGHDCEAGEILAFCSIALFSRQRQLAEERPFQHEQEDLQIAFAAPVAGRLRKAEHSSHGGWVDRLPFSLLWTEDFVIGRLEGAQGPSDGQARLMFGTGRRKFELADDRSGLLSGWHERTRAWWGDGAAPHGVILGLGICDQSDIFKGPRGDFQPLFQALPGPAQAVYVSDSPLVHAARVTLEQRLRTPAEYDAIWDDFRRTFIAGAGSNQRPDDWMFGAAMMAALGHSPTSDEYDVLTRDGLRRAGPPGVVVMSLASEAPILYRHKRLGYVLRFHQFRLVNTGPAVLDWLRSECEVVQPTADEVRDDYVRLYDALNAERRTELIVLNAFSSSGFEDIATYAAFEAPLAQQISTVRIKELNLMLHDLARERDIAVIDVDALGAEHGGRVHLSDGIHQSGEIQTHIRAELMRILKERKVAGF